MRRLLIALCAALLLAAITASPSSAILNGQPDAGRHPYVGIIFNSDIYACTASAISPKVLVTAAHCVTQGQGTPLRVSFKDAPDGTSVGVYHGRGYRITNYRDTCSHGLPDVASPDVGVVVLDQPVERTRYAQLPKPGVVDTLSMHQKLTLVGYGTNDFTEGGGSQPQPVIDRNKRTTSAELLSAGTVADTFIKFNSTGQSGVCAGDSGGPDLLGTTDTIIAVNSFGNGTRCSSVDYGNRIDLPDILAAIRSYE